LNAKCSVIIFKSKAGNTYLYDPNTNAILYSPPGFLEVLDLYPFNSETEIPLQLLAEMFSSEKIAGYKKLIIDWVQRFDAFFVSNHPTITKNFSVKDETTFLRDISNINQLTLEVTQNCNLKCRYCIFSGGYSSFRSHCTSFMPWEIAKQAIDYFFQLVMSETRTRKYGNIYFTFYGGEPLLNFPLIKRCVEYINKSKPYELKEKIIYSMTTNGTLLSEEIIDYLINQEFNLSISLDGPKDEHDKNRVFSNGKGTFEIIIRNIHRIFDKYPNYAKKMGFCITYSHNHNLMNIYEYYNRQFPQNSVRISPVRDQHLIDILPEEYKNSLTDLCRVFLSAVRQNGSSLPNFLREFFMNIYKPLHNRRFYGATKRSFFTPTCKVNSFRLFTDVKGDFHICERINNHFSIGNCREGIQWKRIETMYRRYDDQVVQYCGACPARHICSNCYALIGGEGDFQNLENCRIERKKLNVLLTGYVTLREENGDIAWL